jgi:hypothetical protein
MCHLHVDCEDLPFIGTQRFCFSCDSCSASTHTALEAGSGSFPSFPGSIRCQPKAWNWATELEASARLFVLNIKRVH